MDEIIKQLEFEAIRYGSRAKMAEDLIDGIRSFSWKLALKADKQLNADLNRAIHRQLKEVESLKEKSVKLSEIVKQLKAFSGYVSNEITNQMQNELLALKEHRDLFEKELNSLEEVN